VPQKQPPAKTAVSFPAVAASGASTFGGGIGWLGAALAPYDRTENANAKLKNKRVGMGMHLTTSDYRTFLMSKGFASSDRRLQTVRVQSHVHETDLAEPKI
jgi:hypothetical protein